MLHEPSLNSKFIRKNNHYFNLFKKRKKPNKSEYIYWIIFFNNKFDILLFCIYIYVQLLVQGGTSMEKSTTLNLRINPEIKENAEKVLS